MTRRNLMSLGVLLATAPAWGQMLVDEQPRPKLPAPAPPPLIARWTMDEHAPSPFPSRNAMERFVPLGPMDLMLGVSRGHEYVMRREGETTLGPELGLVWQPAPNMTFYGRMDYHTLLDPGQAMNLPPIDDLSASTTYTIGVGWRF